MNPQDKHNLDELFRKAAEKHHMQPSAGVWNKIEADQLSKNSRRRPLFWIFAVVALLTVGGTAAYLVIDNAGSEKAQPAVAEKTENVEGPENKDRNLTNEHKQIVENTEGEKISNYSEGSAAGTEAEPAPTMFRKKVHKSGQLNSRSKEIPVQKNLMVSKIEITFLPISTDGLKSGEGVPEPKTVLAYNELVSNNTESLAGNPDDEKDINRAGKWFITAGAGPRWLSHRLTGPEQQDELIATRNSSETPGLGFTAGIDAGKYLTKHIYIGSGIYYRQLNMNSNFMHSSMQHQFRSRIDTSVKMDMQALKIVKWYDTVTTATVTMQYNEVVSTIRYNSISVPLMVGMELYSGNWEFGVNTGAGINILTLATGLMAAEDQASGGVLVNELPLRKINADLNAGGYLGYTIYKDWSVYAGPSISVNIFSTFNKAYNIRQYNYNYGFTTGIKKSF